MTKTRQDALLEALAEQLLTIGVLLEACLQGAPQYLQSHTINLQDRNDKLRLVVTKAK